MSDQHERTIIPEQAEAPALTLSSFPTPRDAGDLDAKEYRAFVEATSGAVFRISPDWTQLRRLYGQLPFENEHFQIEDWINRHVHAADTTRVRSAIQDAMATKTMLELEVNVRRSSGRYGWTLSRVVPIINDAGEVVEWLGTATDLDGIRALRRRQDALLAELQHRVRNNLAVVRSIVRRTAANSADLDEFSMHLDGRLASFARTQGAVSRNPLAGLDLKSVLLEELAALLIRDGERAYVTGPDVSLNPKTAETLALAFHELATNAVKFGALAVEGGIVRVSWTIETRAADEDWINLVWNENRGCVPIAPVSRRGFGIEFLEHTLPYDLGASTSISFREEGLCCTIFVKR